PGRAEERDHRPVPAGARSRRDRGEMTMRTTTLLATLAGLLLTACARPAEVRTLATSTYPISVSLKRSSEALQARFAEQRAGREARPTELGAQAARARALTAGTEREWRLADQKDPARRLSVLREEDEAILANPLAPVLAPEAVASKPPKLDQGPIDVVIKNLD